MPTCTQCGSDNPANANLCKYCQGSLKKDRKRTSPSDKVIKAWKDGDHKIHTCPECSADFSHEYDSESDEVITCPHCEQDLKYKKGSVKKLIIGPTGEEYSEYEDPSINVDRFCKNCFFRRSKYKQFLYNDFLRVFIVSGIPFFIAVAPILIWPHITLWYKWISIGMLIFSLLSLMFAWNGSIWTLEYCKKIKRDTESCNPNLRCRFWVKK